MISKVSKIFIGFLFFSSLEAGWLDRKAEGWCWYEDRFAKKEEVEEEDVQEPSLPVPDLKKSSDILAEIKKDLEEKLADAILNPSVENLKAYMDLHKQWVDKSAQFAHNWTYVLLNNPELDNTVNRPVSQYGVQLAKNIEAERTKALISKIASENGLFFFYEGKNKVSQALAKVVDLFVKQYKWELIPVSMDGAIIERFPSCANNRIAETMNVPSFPALYIVDPKTKKAIPIAFGFVTLDQLERNIKVQYQRIKES